MSYIVYCYINKINNKKYIGITSRSIEEREVSHIYESNNKSNKCYNAPFKRAIRKYGIEGFNREILQDKIKTIEEACSLEKYYIKKFKTYYKYKNSNGYNATIGGELIQMPKDRVVQIPLNNLEIIHVWDSVALAEQELNISIYDAVNKLNRQSNGCVWIYEKDFDEINYKEDIMTNHKFVCQVSKGRKLIKIWDSMKSIKEELHISQGNISLCCNGERRMANNCYWCFYKDYLDNNYPIKQKNRTNKKEVIQFDVFGSVINVWDSLSSASTSLNINISDISTACKTHKRAGGFLWRLKTKYNQEDIVSFTHNKKTQVEKLNDNKDVVCIYSSITEASKDVGVRYTGICRAIKNGCRSGGYYWRRKEVDINELSHYKT